MTLKYLLIGCALITCAPAPGAGQSFESIGIRAQGMAGAFVAVADDATATWWNPAGLASGALFSGIVERGLARAPSDESALGVSFVVPSLGLSYYRLRSSAIPPAGSSSQNQAVSGNRVPTFLVDEIGASFGQSIGDHVVVASTLRLLRVDQFAGDIDIGAMLRFGVTRIGLVVKHLHEPELTADGNPVMSFDRQLRIGAAYVPHPGRITLNAAIDADLTTTPTAFGNARHLAGGGELWFDRRLGLRAGVSVNTVDERRPSFSAGASAAVRAGFFLDAQLTRGEDAVKEGWGLAARVTF